ncbi:MAG: flagellar filament capping protein FliD [Alphaproteobacteria bacterium]|nr:flagellar filament capping protein FliD [Alphaproteobacteria bacterium]
MSGVGSVLSSSEIATLIQQASAAYQAPATALQNQEQPIQTQISALGKVQSALSGLQSALAGLADVQTLAQRSVTTSPSGTVSASVTNAASPGTYNLTNIQLAEAQSLLSAGFTSASSTFGAGSITIQVGSGSPVTIDIASGQDTLSGIANAINQANAGVTAAVVYDGTNYHLSLTGTNTGAAAAFTVSGAGGEAGFNYSPNASSGLALNQAATNAGFSLNGVPITNSSNTVTNVVPGLSLTLTGSGNATVTVAQNVSALDQAADAVVSALNNVLQTINQYSSYSPSSGAGPLLGDVGLQVLRNSLLNAISSPARGQTAGTQYDSLGAVGFTINQDGTVSLNDQTFQSAAQANYAAVAGLLGSFAVASNSNVAVQDTGGAQPGVYPINVTNNSGASTTGTVNGQTASGTNGELVVGGAGPAQGLTLQIASGVTGALGQVTVSQGVYSTLSSLLNAALSSTGGGVTGEINNLNSTITSMNQQIAQLQQAAQQETAALTAQWGQAQATLSQLTTVSNFLSTYFNQGSGSGSSGSGSSGG